MVIKCFTDLPLRSLMRLIWEDDIYHIDNTELEFYINDEKGSIKYSFDEEWGNPINYEDHGYFVPSHYRY